MHTLTHKLKELGWRRIAFFLVVLTTLGLNVFLVLFVISGLLGWSETAEAMGHFSSPDIHEFAFSLLFATAGLGMLVQLWKPTENIVGQVMALIPWIAMALIIPLTSYWVFGGALFMIAATVIFGSLTILAMFLHPARSEIVRSLNVSRVNRLILALVAVATIPLVTFAFTQIGIQKSGIKYDETGSTVVQHGSGMHGAAIEDSGTADSEGVMRQYGTYTVAQAEREGYILDSFCLNAESFGQPAELGAMGYHATNEALLSGPITAERPQAFMFDAEGNVLGVEYEIMTEMVSKPPQLFGQTFKKLPPHPGVAHEHYALHVWFIDNPNGQFADFNPEVNCPPGSTPPPIADNGDGAVTHAEMDHDVLGHPGAMAGLMFTIIGVGLLASLRSRGWRLAAWVAGFIPAFLGLLSVMFRSDDASFGLVWGLAAIVWGIAFIAVAEFVHRREHESLNANL